MPELPEVETIVKYLKKHIINKKIIRVYLNYPQILKKPKAPWKFKKIIINNPILKISRLGKYILIELKPNYLLAIHLKMTGNLLYKKTVLFNRYTRLYFKLNNNFYLVLTDIRKFAKVYAGNKKELLATKPFSNLAPDALKIKLDEFKKRITLKKGKIKSLLLDQTKIVCGLGNIYTDELLWQAKIHPLHQNHILTNQQIKMLYKQMKKILKLAIKAKGSTIRTYRQPDGKKGNYQKIRFVYGRRGLNCFYCQTPVEVIKIAGRSSYYCPRCQQI